MTTHHNEARRHDNRDELERVERLGTGHAHATLTAALAYAATGWHVFPLAVGAKRPTVTDWPHAATTDPAVIRAWFSPVLRHPFGIGIACGPSRLVVIDLDHKPAQGITWQDGWTTLRALGDLPRTRTVRTPSGGWHLYYQAPEPGEGRAELRNSQSLLGRGIDTRAAGGYVAAPPTCLQGGAYTVTQDTRHTTGGVAGVAALPAWLAEALRRPEPRPAPAVPAIAGTGRRRAYLDAAVNAETAIVRQAPPGMRNHCLFVAAANLGELAAGGEIPADTVHAVLLDACTHHIDAGAFTRAEADATIRSGLRRGANRPRRLAA